MKYLQENRTVSLIDAAANGDLYEIKILQAMGVDLNQADYDGRTALHLASAGNQLDTVTYLKDRLPRTLVCPFRVVIIQAPLAWLSLFLPNALLPRR
ncbi:MAG: ankyrin repeat domain-containing protein [Cytophagales bacterium]|nr:ankyrin repeat domain-containing protein [Cytophagales bacterium]